MHAKVTSQRFQARKYAKKLLLGRENARKNTPTIWQSLFKLMLQYLAPQRFQARRYANTLLPEGKMRTKVTLKL